MKMKKREMTAAAVVSAAMLALAGCSPANAQSDGVNAKRAETSSSVTTNDNGMIVRTVTETTVTTNGNMVTERKRETRTETDRDGGVLQTATSEYAQSYTLGFAPSKPSRAADRKGKDSDTVAMPERSFLSVKFGSVMKYDEKDAVTEDGLTRIPLKPAKGLEGFDDYYVYLTPKTHRVAKVAACAKKAVPNWASGGRHWLLEALEKKYGTWARLCSWCLPYYVIDADDGLYVSVLLAGAGRDYQTVLAAWDEDLTAEGASEAEELRRDARRKALEGRSKKIDAAVDVF